ncbi:MAG TPA: putative manganese-dependent inorganic diphosphatase [Clostridiaceae bacterium]|nr:putative manganese-dependent inorganic diphosphatase [Clostridiaceae bacterium]
MKDVIYIMGHKNPDTDSICAAIAYSEFKKILGFNAVPVRLGDINNETKYVLEYFNIPAPILLTTVKTQVSDLDIDVVNPVAPDISIKSAWTIMKKNNVKVLPVIDENNKFLGIVSLSDITEKYMDILEKDVISASRTPLQNIVDTLQAKLVYGDREFFKETGNVLVAAMAPNDMELYINEGDIVITGNRKDSQLKAISIGASCLIITCNGQADDEVLDAARKHNCVVMVTPWDTFNTARLINQSIPVESTMTRDNIVSFEIDDYVDDIKDKMLQTRYRSYPVLDELGRIKGFVARYHLISQRRKKVILLDHNEISLTVDGIEQADILEIIDHHRIGDIQTLNPVYFKNEPVGSTSTIIANMYFDNGLKPQKRIAGLLCAAILSDTLKFKSPTNTPMDRTTALRLADIAGIDIDAFASAMFKEGSSLKGKTPEELLYQDFKEFRFGKYKIGIGQINTTDKDSVLHIREELSEYMQQVCRNKSYNLIMLIVTDIINEGSEIMFEGNDKWLISKAFNIDVGADSRKNSIYLKGVMSRKKQIVPFLMAALE